jgi:hypothetical protein
MRLSKGLFNSAQKIFFHWLLLGFASVDEGSGLCAQRHWIRSRRAKHRCLTGSTGAKIGCRGFQLKIGHVSAEHFVARATNGLHVIEVSVLSQ